MKSFVKRDPKVEADIELAESNGDFELAGYLMAPGLQAHTGEAPEEMLVTAALIEKMGFPEPSYGEYNAGLVRWCNEQLAPKPKMSMEEFERRLVVIEHTVASHEEQGYQSAPYICAVTGVSHDVLLETLLETSSHKREGDAERDAGAIRWCREQLGQEVH